MSIYSRTRAKRADYERVQEERINQMQQLEQENQMLKEQIVRYQKQVQVANDQLAQIKQRYQMLINELSIREKAADEISRMALKEANSIIENAQGNADLIVREALGSAKMVFTEIEHVTTQTNDMRQDIQEKLGSMDDMLTSFKIPEIPNLEYLANKPKNEKIVDEEQDTSIH